jgi:hypothetical protein
LIFIPFAVGLTEHCTAVNTPGHRAPPSLYPSGFVAIAAAVILFVSPALVVAGAVVLLLGIFVVDRALKPGQAAFANFFSIRS